MRGLAAAGSTGLLALFLAACASGGAPDTLNRPAGPSPPPDYGPTLDFGAPSFRLLAPEEIQIRRDTLVGDATDHYRRLLAVYEEMELPVTTVNVDALLVGAVRKRVGSRIAGSRISSFLNCGRNNTGRVADQFQVYLTAVSQVEDLEDGGVGLYTHVRGYAIQGGYVGSEVRCVSTGRLEREITRTVQLEALQGS